MGGRSWSRRTERRWGLEGVLRSVREPHSRGDRAVDDRIDEIASAPGVEVFALSQDMLERAISLRKQVHDLRPFDEALLAAVLVRAESLRDLDPVFCTLDADLVPVNRRGQPRTELAALYSAAGLVVRKDFLIPAS